MLKVPTCQKFIDSFRLISQNDVNRIPGVVKATTCKLAPCPSLLVKFCCEKVNVPPVKVINISLREGSLLQCNPMQSYSSLSKLISAGLEWSNFAQQYIIKSFLKTLKHMAGNMFSCNVVCYQ